MSTVRRTEEYDEETGRRRVTIEEGPMTDPDDDVVAQEEVVTTSRDPWYVARGWTRVFGLFILTGLVALESVLALRFGFLLAGANPGNGFVDFIYDVSAPFVDPFESIFARESVDGGIFEPATLIAMLVYFLGTLLFLAVLYALTSGPSPAEQNTTTRVAGTHRAQHAGHEH